MIPSALATHAWVRFERAIQPRSFHYLTGCGMICPEALLMVEPSPIAQPSSVQPAAGRSMLPSLAMGGALFAGLAVLLQSQQREVLSTSHAESQLDEEGQLRPLAEVIETTRALKL